MVESMPRERETRRRKMNERWMQYPYYASLAYSNCPYSSFSVSSPLASRALMGINDVADVCHSSVWNCPRRASLAYRLLFSRQVCNCLPILWIQTYIRALYMAYWIWPGHSERYAWRHELNLWPNWPRPFGFMLPIESDSTLQLQLNNVTCCCTSLDFLYEGLIQYLTDAQALTRILKTKMEKMLDTGHSDRLNLKWRHDVQ